MSTAKGEGLRPLPYGMATYGDHPDLPASVDALLTEQVYTLFLKAGCLPRTKAGHIS